ncbi:MAG: 50S ribosomal protein L20 [Alphaproteobacteria bacterium GM202ARS2]|nr:50S ribosomal protein L20 [Alphaproteobacteria bacterium GM202ARS2]
MPRPQRAVYAHSRHRKVIRQAKGYRGRAKNTFRVARQSVERALVYSYQHRRKRKGDFRRLWIMRLNAAARAHGMTYSAFMQALKSSGVSVNRKMLAALAVDEPQVFASLLKHVRGK